MAPKNRPANPVQAHPSALSQARIGAAVKAIRDYQRDHSAAHWRAVQKEFKGVRDSLVRSYASRLGQDAAKEEADYALLEVVTKFPPNKGLFPFKEVRERMRRVMDRAAGDALLDADSIDEDAPESLYTDAPQETVLCALEDRDQETDRKRARYDGALAAGWIRKDTHQILTLHHLDGLTMREVAAHVGLPYETVKKQLLRGRKRVEGDVRQRAHKSRP